MAGASRNHALAACGSAIRAAGPMPPNARLWLARASLFTDAKGRTRYGPARYAADMGDTEESGARAIDWLMGQTIISHDVDDDGIECWRLGHFDWQVEPVITGYGRDAGQVRDALPPQYGRSVDDVIDPPSGKQDFHVPSWDEIRPTVMHEEDDPEW